MASSAVSYARENQQKFLGELKDLLRIPSVSTAPEHKEDVRRAAMFVADEMRRIGLENVDVIPTKNHPLVYTPQASPRCCVTRTMTSSLPIP
jgi:acetylornithine deacetylase/succinyl-diaminopimelate desuccinylase-like protein